MQRICDISAIVRIYELLPEYYVILYEAVLMPIVQIQFGKCNTFTLKNKRRCSDFTLQTNVLFSNFTYIKERYSDSALKCQGKMFWFCFEKDRKILRL